MYKTSVTPLQGHMTPYLQETVEALLLYIWVACFGALWVELWIKFDKS